MRIGRSLKGGLLIISPAIDWLVAICAIFVAPFVWFIAHLNEHAPLTRAIFDRLNISILRRQYYSPVVFDLDIKRPLTAPRDLRGLDFNEAGQIAFIGRFNFQNELLSVPFSGGKGQYGYDNISYGVGDAELLYDIIRHFKPKRICEVGSGHSTLMAIRAIRKNRELDPTYACEHLCIEPFENDWLDDIGVTVIRKKVEDCPVELFGSLEENDILFIDSTHIIRPQGDVLYEYLTVIPTIKPGVLIHVHDVFTPRDYPPFWLLKKRRLWNEQYILEALLSCTPCFEILAALNWLRNEHLDKLNNACPVLCRTPECQPGAFWFRRRSN